MYRLLVILVALLGRYPNRARGGGNEGKEGNFIPQPQVPELKDYRLLPKFGRFRLFLTYLSLSGESKG
jgi:hypothetical protein